ncbi:MAG: (5-formylfuran-3-yl)methyl phosphate synthase [Candidatus Thorarchaeota archaeon]
MTRLLVTPTDEKDALVAVGAGADIIDVKNPSEGSLGAALPSLIRKIRETIPREIPVSAAVGDVPNLPGTVAQAALGAAMSGAEFVKIGLHGTKDTKAAVSVMKSVCSTMAEFQSGARVVACAYGDFNRAGTLDPKLLLDVALASGADVVMVDTAIKDGRSLFEFQSESDLVTLVDKAKENGLESALAGSLSGETFTRAVGLRPHIVGVRGAALRENDRLNGRVDGDLVAELKSLVKLG